MKAVRDNPELYEELGHDAFMERLVTPTLPGHDSPRPPRLPKIFCWINSGAGTEWVVTVALAEDGTGLGSHVSSTDLWAMQDIGYGNGDLSSPIFGPGAHKREHFAEHYPDGYTLEWVDNPKEHAGLMAAYALNQEKGEADETT